MLERTVAVKTLTPGRTGVQAVQRLLREARACARLTHPGIVTIHDVLEAEGSVYIVMEHLPGASLESLHKFPRFSSFEAKIGIVIRVLDALHYAHGRGVIHRDVKPTNVQILPDGGVKLLDFGIAHLAGVEALTGTGTVTGTAHYASPEQLRGEESGAGTDVYSTGILAYETLTRRRPFDGESVAAVLAKVLHDSLPPMETSWSETFPELERIVQRATAKRSQERYAGAEDMKNALVAFLASSREAIATKQAEVVATTERVIVEAKSLIASGRMKEAEPLLTSALRSNPDAEEIRTLLQAGGDASSMVTEPPTASQTGSESTILVGADRQASPSRSGGERTSATRAVPEAGAVAVESEPARPPGRWGAWSVAVAVPAAIVLLGAVFFGSSWLAPATPGVESELERASSAFPEPAVGFASAPADDSARPVAETPQPDSEGEILAGNPEPSEAAVGASTVAVARRSPESSNEDREGARPADGLAGSAPVAAAPSPAAAARASAASLEPGNPAPVAPVPGAKDLYYAATAPSQVASDASGGPPSAVTGGDDSPTAGIKYRVLQRGPDGTPVEVDPDTMFQSGDRIRFAFEPNIDGFLYVIQRGSTGRWSVLLPHPLIDGGRNTVTRFGEVAVPPEGWFRFDENPGSEQVFVYLSKEPLSTLPWGGGPVISAQSVDQPTMIELANSVRSRDLVFEKETTPGSTDQAAYVVNQDDSGGPVAWTVELHHR
jgi:serine/threonine protein kinase